MSKLRKLTVSCIFILLTLGLFLTCDDPSNPFSNNLGEKVVVEPPTIYNISPVSGSYLKGIVTFTATAKAYIKVEKVEVYIFEDVANKQKEVKWTDKGIQLSGSLKLQKMSYVFDTSKYNSGQDGSIRMKFRIFDTTNKPIESIELVYIIKNRPSVITMAYPNEDDIAKASAPAQVQWNGDIRGQVIDRRGLRPGYPQIKLWPVGKYTDPDGNVWDYSEGTEPDDDDLKWGYASLFLSGYDDTGKEGADSLLSPATEGSYTDRREIRVVNASSFFLHLADYTIVPDPDYPELRRVKYTVRNNKHVPFESNAVFKFKILTRDVSPDPLNGSIPSVDPDPIDPNDPPWIEGWFPPQDFGTPLADSFHIRSTDGIEEPVLITIFSSNSTLTVEINNDDIEETKPGELINKPSIYILKNEKTSYKIEQTGFRLRLLTYFGGTDGGEISKATLEWRQKNNDVDDGYISGGLTWDAQPDRTQPFKGEPYEYGELYDEMYKDGRIFTYTSSLHPEDTRKDGSKVFTHSTIRYELVFKVWLKGQGQEDKDGKTYTFYVFIDGKGPTVSIRSVHGAADVKAPTGAEAVAYTVNGNIQAVVDSRDENSIMAYKEGGDMGVAPPELDNYPMVKWIVDRASMKGDKPAGPVFDMLDRYSKEPTYDNLRDFKAIGDTLISSLSSLPSGWVRRPLPDDKAKIDADKNNHLKLNTQTSSLPLSGVDPGYYWLYVIAMDQVQNLGYTAKKIYVDQDTDIPVKDIQPLNRDTAQTDPPKITKEEDLNVTVAVTATGEETRSGNWIADRRSNVLDRDSDIILNFKDDDGINLNKGGVTIILTDLNTPPAANNPVRFSTADDKSRALLWQVLNPDPDEESVRDMSGTLSQKIMADAFYGAASTGKLKDGKYKVEFSIQDDIDKKVVIGANDRSPSLTIAGDNPAPVTKNVVYYFAVSTKDPDIDIEEPKIGAKASAVPIDIFGTVKSRFKMQIMYIKFTPNVVAYDPVNNPNPNPSYINLPMTPASPAQDAEGYYIYNWEMKDVIFNPGMQTPDLNRSFTVYAYDWLGNSSEKEFVLKVDDSPPSVNLISFNYFNSIPGRTPDATNGKVSVYGKVPFIVSASDTGGLLDEKDEDGFKMSAIKWWVLPATDPAPTWDTQPTVYTKTNPLFTLTPNTWTGGGYFRDNQKKSGGQYTGIIDTRYLIDKTTEYKLYIMAKDDAGNTTPESVLHRTPVITSFTVDQSKDHPVIYENVLSPKKDSVVGLNNLVISGRVYDADLFDPAFTGNLLKKTYVEIRFPASVTNGVPAAWSAWIPIEIPSTYSLAGIDPGNAIVYRFELDDYAARYPAAKTHLDGDGPKYYQIRVTDEPDAGVDGKNFGKNPDLFMTTDKDENNVLLYPGYASIYQKHDKISVVFPKDEANPFNPTPSGFYRFYVDVSDPEIFFNMYDPDSKHENYSADRPTFSTPEQLLDAFSNTPKKGKGNYIKEYKLRNLTMTWSAGSNITPLIKILVSNPPDPAVPEEYPWDFGKFTDADKSKLKAIFNAAPQGLQIISFEATDMVSQTGRATWTFYKDTQGPIINFEISRAIKRSLPLAEPFPTGNNAWPSDWPLNRHTTTAAIWKNGAAAVSAWSSGWQATINSWPSDYAFLTKEEIIAALTADGITPPLLSAFPADWPSDWPTGTVWKDGEPAKGAWSSVWQTIIKDWPSEYAFRKAEQVNDALTKENDLYNKSPSTVIGDIDNPPVLKGTFDDEYSSVTAGTDAFFYYRFKDKKGVLQTIPATGNTLSVRDFDSGKWYEKKIEPAAGGQNAKSANWEIILDPANGFGGTDGENWVDIRVADTPAGNISEIFNVAFLVDRTPPLVGSYRVVPPNTAEELVSGEFKVASVKGYTDSNPTLPALLDEDKRVFSAVVADTDKNGTVPMFSVSGRVNDFNLSNLKIAIGQDGSTTYTVTASADIDLLKSSANPPASGTGVTYTDDLLANGTDTGVRRLTLTGPYKAGTTTAYTSADTGTPEWEWTFSILEKDVYGLRNAAGIGTAAEYSTRRFIRVTASDKGGKRAGPLEWSFYLDTRKPDIEYTNLDKGRNGSSFESDVKLSGLVSDDTKIRDLKYIIGRWEYAASGTNKWRWYDSAAKTWTLTAPPTDLTKWADYFTNDTTPKRQTAMDFTIDNTILNATGKYPENLLNTEGQYRIDLYVTDWSLGSGNPHNTTLGNNDELSVTANGFKDFGYDAKTGAGNASARVFYIDKQDPTLRWASTIEDKTYFRNDANGQAVFGFIAGDGNTLQSWKAEVKQNGTLVENDGIIWQSGWQTTPPLTISQAILEPETVAPTAATPDADKTTPATTAGHKISETSIYEQYFEIKPFMTKNATNTGDALDKGINPLPTYTITVTVTDGAGRSNSITKQFTLDNTPPEFTKFSPPSFVNGTPSTYDAVSGKFNIRGNTSDNSNQLRRVAFYVAPAGKAGTPPGYEAGYQFPNPNSISDIPNSSNEEFWHWHDPAKNAQNQLLYPNRYKIAVGGTTFLEIEDGTFAWNIIVPQTSLFLSDANAQKYVQWTKTYGGKTINNTDYTTVNKYRDVTINPTTLVATTTDQDVPALTFPDLNNQFSSDPKRIYSGEDVGLITVYVLAEDAAGNYKYDVVKYWIWPEGDRPIVTAINSPDSTKIEAERLLNGTIRLSGMAKDNERVKNVWFRVRPVDNNGVIGTPYTLEVPVWKETDSTGNNEAANLLGNPIGGNWEERTGKQDAEIGANIGSRRSDDSPNTDTGWYKANGGNSKEVSWWVYINTKGELDPQGTDSKKEFIVEVRAQDVTWDDSLNNNQGGWKPYTANYRGFSSMPLTVTAWVVAGAPIFEKERVASVASDTVTNWDEKETGSDVFKYSIDRINLRNRSSYKVTVKHSSGLSSIRWSPTQWAVNTSNPNGIFQANPNIDTYNLLDLLIPSAQTSVYVRRNTANTAYELDTGSQTTVFTNMEYPKNATTTPRMALTVDRNSMKTGSVSGLSTSRNYLILKWDPALASILPTSITNDNSYYEPGKYPDNPDNNPVTFKDLKNTVFKPKAATGSIGSAIIIESVTESGVDYYKWDVFVDIRADLLLADMLKDDPAYGNGSAARAGQTKNSVRYPLYLSASEVSKATPLTSRGDALLPIDNLEPYGMYTLNRKPAGTAVTIGGEAGDDGPVNGIARVVVWFQRGTAGVSWHETSSTELDPALRGGTFTAYANAPGTPPNYISGGPVWWKDVSLPSGVVKPAIGIEANGTGGDSAIVIDAPNPSVGKPKWGHTLPMGFSDGGLGKIWYVQINSYGIKSGPIDMHYVVIDKAGNYKYYKEKLVIMNGVAVIDRIKLATDIRHNTTAFPTTLTNTGSLAGAKIADKGPDGQSPALVATQWPILNTIRDAVPLGGSATDINDDVKKGISDWISASALGAGKIIDFNVRNNLFALRIETTKPPLEATTDYTRTFRLEYVSGANLYSDTGGTGRKLTDITAGKIYVINNPGTAKWGTFGAEGEESAWRKRGYAFIATVSGSELDQTAKDNIGTGSVWELTTSLPLSANTPNPTTAESAEFRYGTGAFSTILDNTGPTDAVFPPTPNATYTDWTAWDSAHNWSLFILRVYDGPESNYFGDFNILRVRVNNDDKSLPFAQIYDINPKTEGEDRSNIAGNNTTVEERRSLSPMFIGEGTGSNRTKGGLWNDSPTLGAVEKPGHIEPRRMNGTGYGTLYTAVQSGESAARNHSLSSAQMGGAATTDEASIMKPFANPAGFFAETTSDNVRGGDTVSGRVVLRGYAEDDQRVQRVNLVIGGETITILDYPSGGTTAGNAADNATYTSPKTGMLAVPTAQNGKVYYTDSIDLYRHRVEWAYIWDTETIPAGTVSGNNVSVRVISYPRNGATGTAPKTTGSAEIAAPGTAHSNDTEANRPNTSPYNPGFPVGLNKYNRINFNLRPYITGFLRNKAQFSHDTRSRQGRYMFYRGETAVVKGFNLGSTGTGTTTITINGSNITTNPVGAIGDFGIPTANNQRYRQFQVGTGVTTGQGLVTYSYNSQNAVNTSGRAITNGPPVRPTYIQPWNIEYSPGVDGSRLWDDFTQVHIWQSEETGTGADRGRFPKTQTNAEVFDPSMSIDPATGDLWTSHNEGGFGSGSNSGSTKVGNNNGKGTQTVASFIDPIINSDIYISPRSNGYDGNNNAFTVWAVYSIIGKPGGGTAWNNFGGIWLSGPQGGNPTHTSGVAVNTNNGFAARNDIAATSQYMAESTYYNSQQNVDQSIGPTLNQFRNPHIIVYLDGDNERIHVSYYDTKDGSVKYRYNLRNSPGTVNSNNDALRTWINLDGGSDTEDSGRIVSTPSRGAIDAGEYNSIALTSQGHPVVAYYDKTNQKIKLAISNSTTPTTAGAWTIVDNVISNVPAGRQDTFKGTGQYVSMRIDTRAGTTQNTVHIAAMDSTTKSLVYIKGTISGTTYTCTSVQVVDSVGSVGRWCSLSLDSDGNPWISYQDESYQGARDGIKLAYYNSGAYYKGSGTYRNGEDVDMNNVSITGWEAMHVPTQFRVENARQGMENYPTRNYTGTRNPSTKFWRGAVGYLGQDYFRAAYYVE